MQFSLFTIHFSKKLFSLISQEFTAVLLNGTVLNGTGREFSSRLTSMVMSELSAALREEAPEVRHSVIPKARISQEPLNNTPAHQT